MRIGVHIDWRSAYAMSRWNSLAKTVKVSSSTPLWPRNRHAVAMPTWEASNALVALSSSLLKFSGDTPIRFVKLFRSSSRMFDRMFDGMLDGMFDGMFHGMLDGMFHGKVDGMFDGMLDGIIGGTPSL